jgi:recombination associated protein RdgC
MSRWLLGEDIPEDLVIESECELRDPGAEGGVVRCQRQDLSAEECQAHLLAGKRAVRLALTWDQRLSFVLEDNLSIKRLRFEDIVQEQAGETDPEDAAARFDADFAVMTLELARFLPRLMEYFGGLEARAHDPDA